MQIEDELSTASARTNGAFSIGAIFAYGPMGGLVGLIAGVWIVRQMRHARMMQN